MKKAEAILTKSQSEELEYIINFYLYEYGAAEDDAALAKRVEKIKEKLGFKEGQQ